MEDSSEIRRNASIRLISRLSRIVGIFELLVYLIGGWQEKNWNIGIIMVSIAVIGVTSLLINKYSEVNKQDE